jgi:hypothetical protein
MLKVLTSASFTFLEPVPWRRGTLHGLEDHCQLVLRILGTELRDRLDFQYRPDLYRSRTADEPEEEDDCWCHSRVLRNVSYRALRCQCKC